MRAVSQKSKSSNLFISTHDEEVLVIRKERLFPYGVPHGLHPVDIDGYEKLILSEGQFLWRTIVEEDTNFKQIIPYLVFNFEDKYFLMQRRASASEVRLKSKYSLGIGGHIRKADLQKKSIYAWAEREFKEEVTYRAGFSVEPLGLLNDETDSVGEVHTGFVFLVRGKSSCIKIKSELKSGNLLTIAECAYFYPKMEKWSQSVFNFLKKRNKESNHYF
jgi:predicted NUDIX family phosphoesterase